MVFMTTPRPARSPPKARDRPSEAIRFPVPALPWRAPARPRVDKKSHGSSVPAFPGHTAISSSALSRSAPSKSAPRSRPSSPSIASSPPPPALPPTAECRRRRSAPCRLHGPRHAGSSGRRARRIPGLAPETDERPARIFRGQSRASRLAAPPDNRRAALDRARAARNGRVPAICHVSAIPPHQHVSLRLDARLPLDGLPAQRPRVPPACFHADSASAYSSNRESVRTSTCSIATAPCAYTLSYPGEAGLLVRCTAGNRVSSRPLAPETDRPVRRVQLARSRCERLKRCFVRS